MTVPAKTLIYGPSDGVLHFHIADYPWVTSIIALAAGGASSDGNPGTAEHREFSATELPPCLKIDCGRGGLDAAGRRGEDGYVIIELYGAGGEASV